MKLLSFSLVVVAVTFLTHGGDLLGADNKRRGSQKADTKSTDVAREVTDSGPKDSPPQSEPGNLPVPADESDWEPAPAPLPD